MIFSDDLSMVGASVAGTVVDGARAALTAGCDMVLVCNAPDKADELLHGLDGYQADAASAARIAALVPAPGAWSWDGLQDDPRYRSAQKTVQRLMEM